MRTRRAPRKPVRQSSCLRQINHSVTYNITFADNHAYVETMAHVDAPVTGNWRVEGNHLIITTGLKNDSESASSDTSEIIKLDDSSMILKTRADSLNRKLKTLFKMK